MKNYRDITDDEIISHLDIFLKNIKDEKLAKEIKVPKKTLNRYFCKQEKIIQEIKVKGNIKQG